MMQKFLRFMPEKNSSLINIEPRNIQETDFLASPDLQEFSEVEFWSCSTQA